MSRIDSAIAATTSSTAWATPTAGAGNGYLFATGNSLPDQHRYRELDHRADRLGAPTCPAISGRTSRTRSRATRRRSTSTASQVKTGTVTTDPGDIGGGSRAPTTWAGRTTPPTTSSSGEYSEFAIYNRALSAAEVLAQSGNVGALAAVTLAEADALKIDPIVDQHAHKVVFPVKPGTDLTALDAGLRRPLPASSASPASGTTRDLSNPVTVTLTPTGGGAATTWTMSAVEMGSPEHPGLYADPNVVAYGDTYYIYATTDGYAGWGGKDFYVWSSKDLVDWDALGRPDPHPRRRER